jgi:hypothetical protein
MRAANQAIKRERHIMPTLPDFRAEMNRSKYFSKIDLKQASSGIERRKSVHNYILDARRPISLQTTELRNEQCARTFSEHSATKS